MHRGVCERDFPMIPCILKKYIEKPRHMEFQILADSSGQCDPFGRTGLFDSETSSESTGGIALIAVISEELRQKWGRRMVRARAVSMKMLEPLNFCWIKIKILFYGDEYENSGRTSSDRTGYRSGINQRTDLNCCRRTAFL